MGDSLQATSWELRRPALGLPLGCSCRRPPAAPSGQPVTLILILILIHMFCTSIYPWHGLRSEWPLIIKSIMPYIHTAWLESRAYVNMPVLLN